MKSTYIVIFIAAVVLVSLFAIVLTPRPAPLPPAQTISDPSVLPGIQTTNAPWPPELASLRDRLKAIGLPALSAEGTVLHIHQHLDIFIDGKLVPVPANIGINQSAGFISDIHVHDDSGIVHVESPQVQTFTLGQFFDIWGVKFTKDSIGGYVATGDKTLKVYSNGTLFQGDPRELPLSAHQEIAIVYGTDKETPQSIPSSFTFPAGY